MEDRELLDRMGELINEDHKPYHQVGIDGTAQCASQGRREATIRSGSG